VQNKLKESATRDGTHGEAIKDSYWITEPRSGGLLIAEYHRLFSPQTPEAIA
jgi:hypothetical protein